MMNVSQTSHIDLITTDTLSATITTAVNAADNQVSRTGQLIIGIIVSDLRPTNRLTMGSPRLIQSSFYWVLSEMSSSLQPYAVCNDYDIPLISS